MKLYCYLDSVTAFFFQLKHDAQNEQQECTRHITASSERNKFELKDKTLLLDNKLFWDFLNLSMFIFKYFRIQFMK